MLKKRKNCSHLKNDTSGDERVSLLKLNEQFYDEIVGSVINLLRIACRSHSSPFLQEGSLDRLTKCRISFDLYIWKNRQRRLSGCNERSSVSSRCIGISNSRLHSHAANCTNAADGPPTWLRSFTIVVARGIVACRGSPPRRNQSGECISNQQ